MKNALILFLSLFFTSSLISQTVTVTPGSSTTEVGIPNTYTVSLNAGTSSGNTHYRIDNWLIIANIGSGTIAGNINGQSSPNYYLNPPLNQIKSLTVNTTISIPITYGSNAPDSDNVEFQVSGFYGTIVDGTFFPKAPLAGKYIKQNGDSGYPVDIKIVCAPIISNPTILACNTDNVQICASNYCDANSFTWSVTGGSIVYGQGSNCLIVKPSYNDDVSVTCVAKRSAGLPTYISTTVKTLSRTARTIKITSSNTAYACPQLGKIFQIDNQSGMTGIIWSAPNSNVSAETITDGKRQVTITPGLSTWGAITVSATASFNGGCTASTSMQIPVGGPRTRMENAQFINYDAPSIITATANNNYLHFALIAPLGNYVPTYSDWQYEKISGNFFFNGSAGYNATTRFTREADVYLTGPNPIGSGIKFKARVKSECGWGPWAEYVWNDGTTTPPPPVEPPTRYFKISPNPATSYFDITLLNSSIAPQTSNIKAIKIYSQYGQLLQNHTFFYGIGYMNYNISSLANGIYYVGISFDDFSESHTLVKQ
jgi:hypothetical protein